MECTDAVQFLNRELLGSRQDDGWVVQFSDDWRMQRIEQRQEERDRKQKEGSKPEAEKSGSSDNEDEDEAEMGDESGEGGGGGDFGGSVLSEELRRLMEQTSLSSSALSAPAQPAQPQDRTPKW